ncbi:hypothetical protein DPMN_063706 [Dreissena polymorpha]|uniref:Uncharacterized protein n=1 Tax=Dreissena polymorpha TaxID=45954 RepID=A0A9D4CBV3_DREPO|nr:hypothetical protein DPMN_063706 [Dreissena polymorpha]
MSFVHKTIQEFLTAFHIHRNVDVIDDVISGYLKRHDNSYLDIFQMFIFLCGFNISAANTLSTLMHELDVYSHNHSYFQYCILSGYKEAEANKNTPIHLHLSHFNFDRDNAEDFIQIWTLNTSRARSLSVDSWGSNLHVTIRSQDASSASCHGPGPVALLARKDPGPSTLYDEDGVRSSKYFIEFDLSSCHNLERLELIGRWNDNITVQPHALVGLKKLKYLNLTNGCKCEALDLSHFEHIQSIDLHQRVTLLPLSINNYKTLQCITVITIYYGLDLSMFEQLNPICISNKVKVLPKPLHIHNKITRIFFYYFDFNSVDNEAIYTWCLLNGADPVQCADCTPVLPSIEHIKLKFVTCSSTWLRSLISTMLTLDHRIECDLTDCRITSLDHEVKSTLRGSDMSSCVGDAVSESYLPIPINDAEITTDLNNTCTVAVYDSTDYPVLWKTLNGQNVRHLRLQGNFIGLKVDHVPLLSRLLASLSQLETLTMHLSVYIDIQLPPSLKHLTVCYENLSASELRYLVNKLCALTHSVECRLEFLCDNTIENTTITNIPLEEYISIVQELEALEHVEVKRFRIYDRTAYTYRWSDDEWSVRGSVVDDGDNSDDIGEAEMCKSYIMRIRDDVLNRISMRLQINGSKEQALLK